MCRGSGRHARTAVEYRYLYLLPTRNRMATHLQPKPSQEEAGPSFAETALKLGGKSDDEARRTGAIDAADDQVEQLFAKRFQTTNSPVHRAVWERGVPVELFESQPKPVPPEVTRVMNDSLEVMRRHVKAGTN